MPIPGPYGQTWLFLPTNGCAACAGSTAGGALIRVPLNLGIEKPLDEAASAAITYDERQRRMVKKRNFLQLAGVAELQPVAAIFEIA